MQKKQTQKLPLVSVIMPVYNAQSYLVQAIESVISQSYKNFEFIIIDDHSTDHSWQIIQSYQQQYPQLIRAKRLRKNRNSGGDWAANEAYALSSGAFIARMDADDVMHEKRLEKQITFLLKHPEIAVLGCNAWVINQDGDIVGQKNQPTTHQAIYKQYWINHPMINPSLMFRRQALFSNKQLYTNRFPHNNDLYTFFSMLTQGKLFANLSEKLVYYRVHGNNDSLKNFKKCFWNTLAIRIKAVTEMGYRPSCKAVIINCLQIGAVICLPEQLIRSIYLAMRGMQKIDLATGSKHKPAILKKYALVPNLSQ